MAIKASPPASEQQQTPYLPPGPAPLVLEKFQGIKTSTTRPGVPDESMFWCDGWLPLGMRDARTIPDVGPLLWTAPTTIVLMVYVNFTSIPVGLYVLLDGSIWQVITGTGMARQLAVPGTIQNPSQFTTGIAQYGDSYAIIVTQQTDGYFVYDGVTFYNPGDAWPPGGNLPTGVGGSSVEIYAGRVWVANGPVILFTAPGSVVDFDSGDGGGNFASSDSFLRNRFVKLLQTNGFLYLIGDSSMNYISGVQTSSGSPPITTFTNQNADPEVGTPWPYAVLTFGRSIIYANEYGVQVSFGAAVTKVSEDLDGVYQSLVNFGGQVPTVSKTIIFSKKLLVVLLPIIDPLTGQQVNMPFLWNTKFWVAAQQSIPMTLIASQEIDSNLICWGTDGTNVYPMYQTPSIATTKVMQSKLWDTPIGYQNTKAAARLWVMAQYYNQDHPALTVTIDSENDEYELTLTPDASFAQWFTGATPVTWFTGTTAVMWLVNSLSNITVFQPNAVSQIGVLLGMTISTNSPDMALISAMVQPEIVEYRG